MYARLPSSLSKTKKPTLSKSPTFWAIPLLSMLISGCSNTYEMPADEDAFVSYLQSVSSLTQQLKLKLDDKSDRAAISGLGQPVAQNSADRLEASFKEVARYKESVQALPKDARARLHQLYDELGRSTQADCERLKKLNSKKPQILAKDWVRFCQVTSSVDRLDD